MARCGWVVGLVIVLAGGGSHFAFSQVPDEPVERPIAPSPATRRGPATFPSTRPMRRPATQLAPSKRPPSRPTTRLVTFDLKPQRVTLRLKNKRADQVFGELSKKTGAIFELTPDLWPTGPAPQVSAVEIIDEPFWPALREVFRRTGTRLAITPDVSRDASREQGVIPIGPSGGIGGADASLPGTQSGPLLVHVQSVARTARVYMGEPDQVTRTAMLNLQVLVEPHIDAVPVMPPLRLESAADDQGRPITQGPAPPIMPPVNSNLPPIAYPRYYGDIPGVWRFPLALSLPASDTRSAPKVKAFADFVVMTQGLAVEIPDVLNVAGTELRLANGVRLLIHEASRRGPQQVVIRFVAWNADGAMEAGRWDTLRRGFLQWARRARLTLPDGRTISSGASSYSAATGAADSIEGEFTFMLPGDNPNGSITLLWTAPVEAEVKAMPFELKDVPLR